MKNHKVLKIVLILVVLGLIGAAFGGNSGSQTQTSDSESTEVVKPEPKQEDENKELTLGSTFKFDDLTITIGDSYTWTEVDNAYSGYDHQPVAVVPISVTNNDSESHGLNMFYLRYFGSKGAELDSVWTYFMEDSDSVEMAGKLRPGASGTSYMYLLYDGDGDYYVEFDNMFDKVEVKIPISK